MTCLLAIASAAFAVLGLLIRLTVRDGWSGTALLYYALQLPVIGVLLLFAAAGCLRSGRRRCAGAALALCISSLVSWVALGSVRHSCDGRKGDFRALTWNLAYGRAGWDPIAGALPGPLRPAEETPTRLAFQPCGVVLCGPAHARFRPGPSEGEPS